MMISVSLTSECAQFCGESFMREQRDPYYALEQKQSIKPIKRRWRNCWDITVTESFFSSLKSELIKKRIYYARAQAKSEILKCIEDLYDRRKSPWNNRERR